jgi:formylglycine-generating enzyme required for sulfatase activity
LHGNVWEWCADEQRDPRNELHRVFRGGAWSADAASGNCRAIGRSAGPPVGRAEDRGLRLARVRIKK